jgi:hypothetical protein
MKIIYLLYYILLYLFKCKRARSCFTQYFWFQKRWILVFRFYGNYTGVIHREQWPDLDLKIDTDYAFFNTWNEKMNSGYGISVLNQRENVTNYNFTQIYIMLIR